MEAYDLIPDSGLPDNVKLIEKKKFLVAEIGVKSCAEGEYGYPASEIKEFEDTIEFGNANLLTVEVEEEPSQERAQKKVLRDKKVAQNKNQTIENLKLLNMDTVKISTKFGDGDIDYDLVWSYGPFYCVVYGQPFSVVEALAKLTIQKLLQLPEAKV